MYFTTMAYLHYRLFYCYSKYFTTVNFRFFSIFQGLNVQKFIKIQDKQHSLPLCNIPVGIKILEEMLNIFDLLKNGRSACCSYYSRSAQRSCAKKRVAVLGTALVSLQQKCLMLLSWRFARGTHKFFSRASRELTNSSLALHARLALLALP